MAADSRVTYQGEGSGVTVGRCAKLFRKCVGGGSNRRWVILGTAGDATASMVFVDWYGKTTPHEGLMQSGSDFEVLILDHGKLLSADAWCRPIEITEPFFAIGSGRKCAMAAMDMGANALQAVEIAAKYDPYTAAPFVSMKAHEPNKVK